MADCESQLKNAPMGLWLCELEKDPSTAQASFDLRLAFSAQDDETPALAITRKPFLAIFAIKHKH